MYGEIFLALITGGVLTAIIKGAFDIAKVKLAKKNSFHSTIKDLNMIYGEMDSLKSKLECDRIIIVCTKNGGGIPIPGASLYANILFETYDKGLDSIKEAWQNRVIDRAHVEILSYLEKEEVIIRRVDDLPDGAMKNLCKKTGIQVLTMAKIKSSDKRYYYISCQFKSEKIDRIAKQVAVLDAVQKIRAII